jgi:hypothetical protein
LQVRKPSSSGLSKGARALSGSLSLSRITRALASGTLATPITGFLEYLPVHYGRRRAAFAARRPGVYDLRVWILPLVSGPRWWWLVEFSMAAITVLGSQSLGCHPVPHMFTPRPPPVSHAHYPVHGDGSDFHVGSASRAKRPAMLVSLRVCLALSSQHFILGFHFDARGDLQPGSKSDMSYSQRRRGHYSSLPTSSAQLACLTKPLGRC